jgi:hypothetical protein
MKAICTALCLLLIASTIQPSHAAEKDSSAKGGQQQSEDKGKGKSEDKGKDKGDGNQGGAGVGPPTVHGCDSQGCWNNGPSTPRDPPKKCRKEKGIEICN